MNGPKINIFNAPGIARRLSEENRGLSSQLETATQEILQKSLLIKSYGLEDVEQIEQQRLRLLSKLEESNTSLSNVRQLIDQANQEVEQARRQVSNLRESFELEADGFFDYAHPAENSTALAGQLDLTRKAIKDWIKSKQAVSAIGGFTFNNSASQGKKFVSDMSRMLLRAYNAEAENCLGAVRAGNVRVASERLGKARDQIENLGKMISLKVRPEYHALRIQEIDLAARHLDAVRRQKEQEREERERLREERKAQQELDRQREKLQKEFSHYKNALAALEANGDIDGAERMRLSVASAESELLQVDFRAANIRAGYVYVISNAGSFGVGVVKIGMTRRLDPMDRINELGDASVPFRFDVHALFFAHDAIGIEALLHQHFSSKRINRVNLRREFFRATPTEVLEVLREHKVETLEYQLEAASEEYRLSITSTQAA